MYNITLHIKNNSNSSNKEYIYRERKEKFIVILILYIDIEREKKKNGFNERDAHILLWNVAVVCQFSSSIFKDKVL